jgi:hypothetical protein
LFRVAGGRRAISFAWPAGAARSVSRGRRAPRDQ